MLDMSEFGEAAPYLRKSYTEQLKLQTIPFDGKSPRLLSTAPCVSPAQPLCHGSLRSPPCPFPCAAPQGITDTAESPQHPGGQEDLKSGKSRLWTFPWFAEVWVEVILHLP